jgi:hypothetical protein
MRFFKTLQPSLYAQFSFTRNFIARHSKLDDEQLWEWERANQKYWEQKILSEPSIIHVILLNRTLRILLSLGIFCVLVPLVDYFYFYSSEIAEYEIDDSGICSHYPIYQIPCGSEVSIIWSFYVPRLLMLLLVGCSKARKIV